MFETVSRATSLPRKLVSLIRLEPNRRRLALEAWSLVCRTTMEQRFRPYQRWNAELARTMAIPEEGETAVDSEVLYQLLAAYRIGLRGQPIRPNCLQRSRALWQFLQHHGVLSRLVIGTRLQEGQLLGHAWVELDGKVLNDLQNISGTYHPLVLREGQNLHFYFD